MNTAQQVATQCPCCLIEQRLPENPNAEPRVCARHYAHENAVWQEYRDHRNAVQALQNTPSFMERFQDDREVF